MSDKEIELLAKYGHDLLEFMTDHIPDEHRVPAMEWLLAYVFGKGLPACYGNSIGVRHLNMN